MLSSAGVAPLPPGFHKLLSVTVTTFAVFLSWMYLLGGDDNCMLSVPSSTCDLHIGTVVTFARRWLLKLLRCSTKHCGFPPNADDLLVQSCCLAKVSPVPRFQSSRPDTASFRSCLLLPPGFLDTREAGICARSRALSSFISLLHLVRLVVALAWWSQAACK